jgi:replication-associated recombination protein RarA
MLNPTSPLAERMRPQTLDALAGQEHLTGAGSVLRQIVERGKVHSMILWGPPGVGKTSKSNEIIKKELGLSYDDFYNISLDSLVERVKPYRKASKRLYNTLKNKKAALGSAELNEKNLQLVF